MAVALRLLAVPIARLLIALILWGLALTTRAWLKPMYTAMGKKDSFMGQVLRGSGVGYLVKGIDWATHWTAHKISHHAAGNVAPLGHYLEGHAQRTRAINAATVAFAEASAAAVHDLRFHTMPRAIHRQVAPVAATAAGAAVLGRRSISLGQKERTERRRSIDRLARVLGGLAIGFAGIDALVKRPHARAHHRDHTTTIPRTATQAGRTAAQVRAHARRIARLERLLSAGALAAAITAVLIRAIPSWRCSNFGNIRRSLKCSHWRWLEALLFLAVDVLTLRDLCLLVGYIERGATAFQPVIHELVVTGENFLCGDPGHMPSAIVGTDRDNSPGYASGVVGADFSY